MTALERIYACLQQSRLLEAEQLLTASLLLAPREPALHRARAVAAQMSGRLEAAIDAMRTAVALAPGAAGLQMELGQLFASAAQPEPAVAAFRQAAMLQPEMVEAWYLLGMTLYGTRRDADALPALARAHALAPNHPQIQRALAETHYALEQHAEALALFEGIAAAAQTHDAMLFLRLSQCRRRTGAPAPALAIVREGIARHPDDATLWQELGGVQEDLGDAGQAQDAYARAHALQPEWGDPIGAMIALGRGSAPAAVVEKAHALLAVSTLPEQQQAFLHHVLGKRSDSLGDYPAAADHWRAANRLRRSQDGGFEREAFAAQIDAAIAAFTPEMLAGFRGTALRDEGPVFVVGMPRSGTTLVEQIIAAHPQAYGCGELTGIVTIADGLPQQTGLRWPQDAAGIDVDRLRAHAEAYRALAARDAPADARRWVDKQPYNFLHVGLIAMLFADARIVWCRRDPRDIALSIFSESFAPSATYATDLDDIAFVIAQQQRLMLHWQAVVPLPMLEMQYETVVTDIEAQVRRLIDFVGLPWDARCLDFHNSGRSVQTISRWQVRQPVHTRSVGRWRHYPEWFGDA